MKTALRQGKGGQRARARSGSAEPATATGQAAADPPAAQGPPVPAAPAETPPETGLSESFRRLASHASDRVGSPWAFGCALGLVLGWAAVGPFVGYSEGWQLVINTGTTIITFLMVFLIQASQNRDAKALQLKLDELIRSSQARNVFADLQDASEQELADFQREFEQLRKRGGHGPGPAAR